MHEIDVPISTKLNMRDPDPWSDRGLVEFYASHGGPSFGLQARLKLLRQGELRVGSRSALFVALAWGVPFLLGLPHSLSLEAGHGSYLADIAVWAKFFIGICAFIVAEDHIEKGLKTTLAQFFRGSIIAPASLPAAVTIVAAAVRQRDSRIAEIIFMTLAVLASTLSYINLHTVEASSWAVEHLSTGNMLTPAGWWSIGFSLPLFTFLFLKVVWRHAIWTRMLRKFARLELRLVATHPDGKGGLAFLGRYPNAYSLFVFGMSCAIAAAVAKHTLQEDLSTASLSMVMSGWLAIIASFFAYPLSAFSSPLLQLKAQGLYLLSARATQFCRSAERKAIGRNVFADSSPEPDTELPDPAKFYETTRKLSTILFNRADVVLLAAAALIPFAILGAMKLPYKEVISVLKKLLLL